MEALPSPLKLLRLIAVLLAIPLLTVLITAQAAGASTCNRRGTVEELLACVAADAGPVIQQLAVTAVLLGLGLVVGISLAGALARINRVLLVALFIPGLYLTNLALIVLVLLHGLLALASLTFVASLVRIPLLALGLLVIAGGTVCGILAMIRTSFRVVRRARATVSGRLLEPGTHFALSSFVRQLAESLGTRPPTQIVAGLEPTFFVTEADVQCLDGRLKGRTLYVSLAACRILTQLELQAIISHELAHFRGWDTGYSRLFYPFYRGTANSLTAVAHRARGGIGGVAFFPAWYILGYFLESFAAAERDIGRQRELTADRVAAGMAGEVAVATALVKLYGFSRAWWQVQVRLREAVARSRSRRAGRHHGSERNDPQALNLSTLFVEASAQLARSVWLLKDLDDEEPLHPTDSHPPLSTRLQALQLSISDVARAALRIPPERAAISLFADPGALERDLTAREVNALAHSPFSPRGKKGAGG
jgi:Zn-dependent protease with chaperone function